MKLIIDLIVYSVVGGYYLLRLATHLARAYLVVWVFKHAALIAQFAGVELVSIHQQILIPVGLILATAFVLWLPEFIMMVREARRLPPVQWTDEMELEYQKGFEELAASVKKNLAPMPGSPEYRFIYGSDLTDPTDPANIR